MEVKEESEDKRISKPMTMMSNLPRDLLQRFISVSHLPVKLESESNPETEEELELTLGLSSNGRFGVDPRAKKIKRTSSIPEFVTHHDGDDATAPAPAMGCTPLMRTCSLPTETEEEWRRRKELQTLRRMEARRKRSEKQRNSKSTAATAAADGEEDKGNLRKTTSLTRACLVGLNLNGGGGGGGGLPPTPPSSQGTGSSGISESESQPATQGAKHLDARRNSSERDQNSGITEKLRRLVPPESRSSEVVGRNVLEDMPCVSTKGEGPNGKRIQGFLYGYKKGEEVRIVCVCHGTFLTPAEFIKHAGGSDVAHPLKHIVVTPSFL